MADAEPSREDLLAELAALRARLTQLEDAAPRAPDELRFVELLNHVRDVVLIVQDGIVKYANHAFDGAGYALEEVVGRPIESLGALSPEMLAHYRARVAGEAAPTTYSSKLLAKDGREIDVEISAVVARVEGIPSVVVVLHDISEQQRMSRELGESEERFRCLSEAAFEGLIIHKDGRVVEVNRPMCELTGRRREDVLGMSILDLAAPESHAAIIKNVAAGLEDPIEVLALDGDGTPRPIELMGKNIVYKGQPARVTAVRDISERKKLQAQVQRAQKLESLGVLAGGIAHDFNNLLMGVLGNASVALNALAPESPARRHVEEIIRAGEHAAELTNQMLAYSGGGRFVVEPLDLSRLIEETEGLLGVSISKKVTLQCDLSAGLPLIEADAGQIRQVVMNLVINASEASAEAGGVVTVRTESVRVANAAEEGYTTWDRAVSGAFIRLQVIDTGCGMDAATMERIFDPFFTTKFAGRGLGLAAVLGIVRAHRGAIRVSSAPGQGCRFEILLPAVGQAGQPTAKQPAAAVSVGEVSMGGTVLLVEDDPTARLVARKMLEALGFSVLVAGDGAEALELFNKHADALALVLLDTMMPVMSGDEVLEEVLRIRPQTKVILSSGYEEHHATKRLPARARLAGFIQKPYKLADLERVIREAL